MKAKACTRCRQMKFGCDADVSGGRGCTRCRSLDLRCTFDSNFRRTPKRKRLAELQAEVAELRELTHSLSGDGGTGPAAGPLIPTPGIPDSAVWPLVDNATSRQPPTCRLDLGLVENQCVTGKSIGDVHLGSTQVTELFRIYFLRCQPYLPFRMCPSIEVVYERCPLLFWVICAVASAESARPQFEEPVLGLLCDVLNPTRGTVEVVQALLILCMWPFPFVSQMSDPSFIYSGIATQIALQIGLHRPAMAAEFSPQTGSSDAAYWSGDQEIRRTTWLACFVVNQIQASRRGVPATILTDFALLSAFDDPTTPAELSTLCHISHLAVESAHAIGARGANASGLVDPAARISLISVFARQFDALRRRRFSGGSSDVVELFFLGARLQLWSFALHGDVPVSTDAVQIVHQAREDAIRLIQVACEKNLALVPFYTCRSVCYSVILLHRTKMGPYAAQDDLVDDHIARALQALSFNKSPNFSQFLTAVVSSPAATTADDTGVAGQGKSPSSHRSRMGAALVFDSVRLYADSLQQQHQQHQQTMDFSAEFLDLDLDFSWADV